MSPKAHATGGETLDSPLRIEFNEHSKRKSFRKALKNPTKLFRDRKPAKQDSEASTAPSGLVDRTRTFPAIAVETEAASVLEWISGQSPEDLNQEEQVAPVKGPAATENVESSSASSQKRKQSQDHIDGTARSTSKSRRESEEFVEENVEEPPASDLFGNLQPLDDTSNPLQAWFEANRENPYPSAEAKEWLAQRSGRTLPQISNWFHHKRSREKSLERAEIAESAVRQWMDGLNANEVSGPAPQTLTSRDPLTVEDAPKRWSQAEVVLNLLEQNKNEIARAAGNYFSSQPEQAQVQAIEELEVQPEVETEPESAPINCNSAFSKRDSSTGKRDSTMTTTTFAPSVFSRSSTWTEYTGLTTPSDVLAEEGPMKRRFRDSRDSSMFSKPATSARSSIISHPAIPFRTRSLRFDQNRESAPETPKKIDRSTQSRKDRPKSEGAPPQMVSEADPDDVFSFEPPMPVNRSSYVAAMAKKFDEAHMGQTNSGKHASTLGERREPDDLTVLAQINSSSVPSPRWLLDLSIESTKSAELPIDAATSIAGGASSPSIHEIKASSPRSMTPSIKSSHSMASPMLKVNGPPVAPERTSSLRIRTAGSISSETSNKKRPLSPLVVRTIGHSEVSLPLRQNKPTTPRKSPGKVSFSDVTSSQEAPFPIPERKRPTLNTKCITEKSSPNQNLDVPESETSMSIDESDYDDASSGITDYSEETVKDMPRTDGLGPVLQLVLTNIRRDVVARVIQELHGTQQHGTSSNAAGSSTNSQRGGSADIGTPSSQPSGIGNKRPSRDRDSNTPDDRDDGDGEKRRKFTHQAISASILRSRFACPFYKHNSEHHQRWRSCRGPGWDEVRRVKEHVYRRHVLPIRCMRCLETFKDEATLGAHAQQDVPCQKSSSVPENVIEGCDKDQEKRLKCRKRKPGETEEDRWADMYRILFGEDCEIPTPYYDLEIQTTSPNSSNLPIIEDHLRQLPQRLAVDINRLLNRPLDDEQRAALPAIIRSSLQEVMQPFLHMLFPSPVVSQPHSAAPSSDPGDSAYGSVDYESRRAITPPYLPIQDMGSRTTLGTVPEGSQAVHYGNAYTMQHDNPVPLLMVEGRQLQSAHGVPIPSTQAWGNTTYTPSIMNSSHTAYDSNVSSFPDPSTGLYVSASPDMVNHQTSMAPADDFSHLLYPQQSFLPDPPRPPTQRWSMALDPEASQNLTPIWDQQFPFPAENQSFINHYNHAMTQPPSTSLPILSPFSSSQQDLTQTFPSWMLTEEGRNFIPANNNSSTTNLTQQKVN